MAISHEWPRWLGPGSANSAGTLGYVHGVYWYLAPAALRI